MKSQTLKTKLEELLTNSHSRPSVNNVKPYVGSLFRTLKCAPSWQSTGFANREEARQWFGAGRFSRWYNQEHRHSATDYLTPK
ncbi:integrase core domain-containing protein [Sodalis sp. RH20]|uniref:integrase core domain-containing protein n=1 Tax=unclassified Sodalis (in: enterobacteria) TaxID=2636512 RepID=UPI0039B4D79E